MNMIGKFVTGLVAVAASGAIILTSTSAGSKSAQPDTTVAAADASQSRVEPFNYGREFVRWVAEPAPANDR
jgi:hypothetical protein